MKVFFLVPGHLDTLTGGYIYDRRIVEGLRARGIAVDVRELDSGFPYPTRAALEEAARQLGAIPDGSTVIVDGLALGAMPLEVEREASRLQIVALVHHPLAAESGVDADAAAAFRISERRALATARAVVVTSSTTANALEPYGVPSERLHVVEPGTDPAPLASGSGTDVVRLLAVATLIPRKGHEMLFHALAAVPHQNWRLVCVGSLDRHPPTANRLRTILRDLRLEERVSLAGEMDGEALAHQYDSADVFVLPTLYEGYGMAVAEALARGLPVISTSTGAIAELVMPAAGLLVQPTNVAELAGALSAVIGDPEVRMRLSDGARAVRKRLPTWEHAATKMAEVMARVQR